MIHDIELQNNPWIYGIETDKEWIAIMDLQGQDFSLLHNVLWRYHFVNDDHYRCAEQEFFSHIYNNECGREGHVVLILYNNVPHKIHVIVPARQRANAERMFNDIKKLISPHSNSADTGQPLVLRPGPRLLK